MACVTFFLERPTASHVQPQPAAHPKYIAARQQNAAWLLLASQRRALDLQLPGGAV
jgi:hypothetical protein